MRYEEYANQGNTGGDGERGVMREDARGSGELVDDATDSKTH